MFNEGKSSQKECKEKEYNELNEQLEYTKTKLT